MSNQQPHSGAALPSDAMPDLQREVQRLLGRCMLRLQQYERLLKDIVAHHELAGPVDSLERIRDARIRDAETKTLGILIGKFLESCVVVSGVGRQFRGADMPADAISLGWRIALQLDAEDHARTTAALKELVVLRNELVHHLIERFNLWEAGGCAAAKEHLLTCYDCIDAHYEQLRSWINNMEETRQHASTLMQSPAFLDLLVNGNEPDSK